MKKILILAICILPFLKENTCAQGISIASTEEKFSEKGRNIIVRANPNDNNNPLIYYCTASPVNRKWYFLYHSFKGNGNAYKFLWPTIANEVNTMTYNVHDMLILGNYCYFCGTCRKPISSYYEPGIGWAYVYDSTGFIGRISIDKLTSSSPVIFMQLQDIPETKNLTKIDATVHSGETILALVGKSAELGIHSSLVLINELSSSWYKRVYPVNNSNEILTDAIFTKNHLITVSVYDNEHFSFGLRREGIPALSVVPTGPYNLFSYSMLSKYNTYNMTGPLSSNPQATWHHANTVALLSCIPGSDTVTVAYQSLDTSAVCPYSQNQTALFQIVCDPSDNYYMKIRNAQLVSSTHNEPYTFVDMKYIPYDRTIAFLQYNLDNLQYSASVIQFASWNTLDTDIPNISSDLVTNRSMDIWQDQYFYLSGSSQSDSALITFMQNKHYVNYPHISSCYATRPLSYSRSITNGEFQFIHTAVPPKDKVEFACLDTKLTAIPVDHYNSCLMNADK